MAAKEIVKGLGTRFAEVFLLDADGLPSCQVSSAVPVTGTLIEGVKTFTPTAPAPRRITHVGQDRPQMQDTLPALEVGAMTITTSSTNLKLDAMLEGNKVRTINTVVKARAVNTDKRGEEPQVFYTTYRQALDADPDSATYGKLRQWHQAAFPSLRISPSSQAHGQAETDKTYEGTPTPVSVTPWNEAFNDTNWGNCQAEYIELVSDYQPRWNVWLGNGTLTAFQLSHPPADSAHLHVWVDGTLTAPSAVNVSTANPAFTLGAAAANAKKVIALIETTEGGC